MVDCSVKVITIEGCEDRLVDLTVRLSKGGIQNYNIFYGINKNDILSYQKIYNFSQDIVYPFGKWNKDSRLKNINTNLCRIGCYLSHYNILKNSLDKPILICEDDIYFTNSIVNSLNSIPDDCFLAIYDCSHIEGNLNGDGWVKINPNKFRVWCTGCYYVKYPNKLVDILNNTKSKVYDKCLIDSVHKVYPCYIYLEKNKGICYQDRKNFISKITPKSKYNKVTK